MLRINWRKFAKNLGLGIAAVTFVTVLILISFFSGISSGYQEADTHRHRAAYSAETNQRIAACEAQSTGAARIQCLREAIEAGHENQRDEADLSAQRYMSKWAGWLLIVALWQLPIGTLGLLFLLRSIWQGQEALAHAQRVSDLQLRPYVYFGDIILTLPFTRDSKVIFELKNYGLTPAINMRVGMISTIVGVPIGDEFRDDEPTEWEDLIPLAPQGETKLKTPFKSSLFTDVHLEWVRQGLAVIISRLRVTYEGRQGFKDSTDISVYIDRSTLVDGDVMTLNEWARQHHHEWMNTDEEEEELKLEGSDPNQPTDKTE